MDSENIRKWFIVGLAIIVVYFVYKIFLKKAPPLDLQTAKDLKGSDKTYWKKKQLGKFLALGGAEVAQIAKDMHSGLHFVGLGIKDNLILDAAYKIKSQKQLSQVVNYYQIKYKKNMFNDMATTIGDSAINKWASNDVYNKVVDYFKTLPDALDS